VQGTAVPLPVVPAGKATPVQGEKALGSPGKVGGLHGREGKASGSSANAVAGVAQDEKATGEAVAFAPAVQAVPATGTVALNHTGLLSVTPASTVSPALIPPGVATGGLPGHGKGNEGEHRAAIGAGLEFHGEMEGARGPGFDETRTLVSTPHVLEVGITGGAHGWLRVRAELEHTGEVTASLVASSAASADALHKELGAMSAYLKSEVVGVSSLAVTAMEKGGATQGLASQGGASAPGAGAQGRSSRQGGEEKQPSSAGFSLALSELGTGYSLGTVPGALLGAGVGGWLNVRV
jgi:hypothetical protein